ncbi:2',5'-phosphodiesterase 12 [Orussus abietinus]|uniref:2',5'-phosphodiesterase 12 n=1 Tax=Orussus abietinus TaxID=222816 RepID=UPI0006253291|nr:2',5'-phosphodiesterase 12 [Orussus abietinus]
MSGSFLLKWHIRKEYITSLLLPLKFTQQCRFNHCQPRLIFKMNEVFLRYEKGNDTFDVSFRYVNPDLNVDRQFNFTRKSTETISNFLKRINANVGKIISNKQARKLKKKAKAASAGIEVVSLPVEEQEVKALFLQNDEPINEELSCETILQNTENLTLVVGNMIYSIKLNAPWISDLALPSSMLAGFPVYPSKLECMHMNKEKSIFIWSKSNVIHQEKHSGKIVKEWQDVGKGFVYLPTTSDIGYKLKLSCLPINEKYSGPVIEAESPSVVEAGPGHCPFETRHAFTATKLSGKSFRIVSYNILADTYADSDYSRESLFPYCPPYALAIDYRKQLILKELLGYNSDIICLQEVDAKVYSMDLLPFLSTYKYDGVYNKKGCQVSEGLATLFNAERFENLYFEFTLISENVHVDVFNDVWSKIKNDKFKERFLERNTTVQVTVLQSKENPSEIIVIGNTHLYFHPDADHIRLLQAFYALIYTRSVAESIKKKYPSKNVSIILCGDFNSSPQDGIYHLMTQNHIPENHKDWCANPEEAVQSVSLSHDLELASACGTPQYTNYTVEFADCLDYIFYQTNSLKVAQIVPMPSIEELQLHSALPSVVFPSDHISICADLKWII